jgi:hypothetical protein
MRYFFTFFRIFRFEHSKVTYFFRDFSLLDFESLSLARNYNQNFAWMAELEYHNVHVNHNFKLLALAAYFGAMPALLAVDFFVVQCTASCRAYRYISEKIPQKYFFSGPLLLFTLASMPIGISCLLEFRFYTLDNEFQMYSFATCGAIMIVMSLFWLSLWVAVFTHFNHKQHPLVLKRFGLIFANIKPPSNDLIHISAVPLYVTRRMASMFVIGLLCRYTTGPLIMLAFFQAGVSQHIESHFSSH